MQIPRQDPGRVGDRLPAAKLQLIRAQRQRVSAELAARRPETKPAFASTASRRRGRRSRPASASAPRPSSRPALSSAARAEQRVERRRIELFTGEQVSRPVVQGGHSMEGMELGALTWNLFHGRDHPPEPGSVHLALAPVSARPEQRRRRTGRSTATCSTSSQRSSHARELGRRPPAGVPAALERSARRRLRCLRPRGHDLPQLARLAARERSPASTPT